MQLASATNVEVISMNKHKHTTNCTHKVDGYIAERSQSNILHFLTRKTKELRFVTACSYPVFSLLLIKLCINNISSDRLLKCIQS